MTYIILIIKMNPKSPYILHTLRYKYFYRIPDNDHSITFIEPKEGYCKRKEEDFENITWFHTRWNYLYEKKK